MSYQRLLFAFAAVVLLCSCPEEEGRTGWKRLKSTRPGRLSVKNGHDRETEISKRRDIEDRDDKIKNRSLHVITDRRYLQTREKSRTSRSPRNILDVSPSRQDLRWSGSPHSAAAARPSQCGRGHGRRRGRGRLSSRSVSEKGRAKANRSPSVSGRDDWRTEILIFLLHCY